MEDQADDEGREAKPVISTEIDILMRWLEIRAENGYEMPGDVNHFKITCHKSALLHRMLKGKDPYLAPPPKSHSYPWYSLIDNGIDYPFEVWEATDDFTKSLWDYPALVIDQSPWKILETLGEDSWIITYQYGPDNNKQFADGKWHVYCVGSRVPQTKGSANKLWEIKKIDEK